MAKYTFLCDTCSLVRQVYGNSDLLTTVCTCGSNMTRQIPTISKPTSYERPDKLSSVRYIDNHQEEIKARKEQHYWEVEVPRFVASGVYTMETMLENGWVSIDDSGKMTTNTKPPQQR